MTDLDYAEIDGLLYPKLETGMEHTKNNLGKYGIARLCYLHEQKPQLYRKLLFTGKLAQHCAEIELAAFDMVERIRWQYFGEHPAPAEGMERVQAFEQAQMIADETVLAELICR